MSEENNTSDRVGVASAALLAAATVGSAWCAYQATLWSGEQIRSLAAANTAHFESLNKTSAANLNILIDVSTFLSYIQNRARGDAKITAFIQTHARKEFRPVLDAWIAEADQNPDKEPVDLPFKAPRYQVADMREAERLETKAQNAIASSNAANAHGDQFVLHTVLFALGFFFLGATSSARRKNMRRVMLALGALIFTLSVLSLARLPRAPSEARQRRQTTFAPGAEDSR